MLGGLKVAAQRHLRDHHGINVERWSPPVDPQWHRVVSMMRTLEIDTLLDVGAHRGESGVRMRSAGFAGMLVSFEPSPSAFHALGQRATTDERWTVVPMALGSRDDEQELQVRQ